MTKKIVSDRVDYSSKSKLIQEFLANYPSESTRTNYSSMLNHFFNFIKIEPDNYFDNNRDYSRDVKNYAISMTKFAPKTKHTRLACLKSFLLEYDIELKQKVWKSINRRGNGNHAITQDKIPTPSELKKIFQFGTIKSSLSHNFFQLPLDCFVFSRK
jgi:hypothetical protein